MEHGPIPPHERAWRHPSELGPTSADVARSVTVRRRTTILALGSGVLAVVAITAIVAVATPRPSTAPIALSATTTPVQELRSVPAEESPAGPLLATFTPIPNEIASAPELIAEPPTVAAEMPDRDEPVVVQTPDVTYHCAWSDVKWIDMPNGSIVFDGSGDLLAVQEDGELISVVAD